MARASPIEYKMYYRVSFETVIRGHHVYKYTWTPQINQVLQCEEDTRAEAKEYDANTISVYVIKPDANKTPYGPCADRTIALVELLPTSKCRKSAGRTSNGGSERGKLGSLYRQNSQPSHQN